MKMFLLAVAAALVIAGVSWLALSFAQQPSYTAFSTESTRVGEPGHNLLVNGARQSGESH